MLSFVSQKCTGVLLVHKKIREDQKAIYEYGFTLLLSTTTCIVCILLMGELFRHIDLAITFLLYFIPIRIAAGGYHAKSCGRCFVLTNTVAVGCIVGSGVLWNWKSLWLDGILALGLVTAFRIIWVNAPIIPKQYKARTTRYYINQRYARIILALELVVLFLAGFQQNNCIVYTAILTCYAVAIMMLIAKERGE